MRVCMRVCVHAHTHRNIEMYRYLAYIDVSNGVCMLYFDQGEPGPVGPAGPVGDPGVGMVGLKVTLEENLVRSYFYIVVTLHFIPLHTFKAGFPIWHFLVKLQ